MLVKLVGENYTISLTADEAAALVDTCIGPHPEARTWELAQAINRLWWAQHGFNISDDMVDMYEALIEWGDDDEEER
jgi:hypothetical protein